MQPDYYDELKTLNDDVDELVSTVDKIPGFVVKTVKESEDKTNKNLKKLDDKISKIKNIEGRPGKDGKDGRDGRDGKDGQKGLPGKDGSPDTPLEIADKLNTLEGAIDASVIKNNGNAITTDHLNQILKAVSSINNVRTAMANASQQGIQSVVHDSSLSGLGTTASPLSVISVIASDVAVTVRAATTAALAGSPVYANGSSGVGATLTRGTNGVLAAQDGITLTAGDLYSTTSGGSTFLKIVP